MKPKRPAREINAEILSRLDLLAVYRELGVETHGEPRASGMVSCRAVGRDDRKPSAWINVQSGYYGDSGATGVAAGTMSLFDFAVLHGGGRYGNDWREARKIFADRAGVRIAAEPAADANGKKKAVDGDRWRDRLEFQEWTAPGAVAVAHRWCLKCKPGVTVEAIQSAGGRLAYYPCFRDDSGELKRRKWAVQVVAVPAYGADLLAADPVAWVIWDVTGAGLRLAKRKGQPDQEPAKMLSIGSTAGAMMGLHGLMILADDERRAKVRVAWKTGGPTDLLALWAAIPDDRRETDIVVTNASGENGEVAKHQGQMLAGLPVAVVHDCDDAGEAGREKWGRALTGVATDVRQVRLPWQVKRSHGEDIRDFLAGKETDQ